MMKRLILLLIAVIVHGVLTINSTLVSIGNAKLVENTRPKVSAKICNVVAYITWQPILMAVNNHIRIDGKRPTDTHPLICVGANSTVAIASIYLVVMAISSIRRKIGAQQGSGGKSPRVRVNAPHR